MQRSRGEDLIDAPPANGERRNGRAMTDNVPLSATYDVATAGADVPASNDQFRIAIDTIPGLVWTAQPDGYVDFLNQRWLDYTGLTLEQAIGWGWQAAISP